MLEGVSYGGARPVLDGATTRMLPTTNYRKSITPIARQPMPPVAAPPVTPTAQATPPPTATTGADVSETGVGSQSGSAYSYSQIQSVVDAPIQAIESMKIPGWAWAIAGLALIFIFIE